MTKTLENAATPAPSTRTAARILVGIDGSEQSIDALRRAVRLAGSLDAPVHAVITWRAPVSFGGLANYETSPETDATNSLRHVTTAVFGDRTPEWFTQSVLEGVAAHVLVAESVGSQMLVVGHHGHGALADLPLGSVSAACALRAHCPVLIMHDVRSAGAAEFS
ncbi:universal stress protein [Subtercola sp. RTI3]|uniref:universal stress protein n=1 Tax=Subtercola sp. RTI3 TaxID=3048639 RepID=UPI002B23C247|nr:universal stress protein [Subtercola sp. RTI3]MEA9983814.1 universal stress protein [Subtercola sp. RTI3]